VALPVPEVALALARRLAREVGVANASILIMCVVPVDDDGKPLGNAESLRLPEGFDLDIVRGEFDRLHAQLGSEGAIRYLLGVPRGAPAAQPVG
jgi:hypothetical protein